MVVAYVHDDLYRLTREYSKPDGGSSPKEYGCDYWYDAVGNRTKFHRTDQWYPGGNTYTYDYSPRNELTKESDAGNGYSWQHDYDLRGNLTKKSYSRSDNIVWTYGWSSQDELTTATYSIAGVVQRQVAFKYDGMGRRVGKQLTTDGQQGPWQWYAYDGLQVIAEGTGTSDRIAYTNSPAVVGGMICRDATGAGGEKYFYHFDRLGNVVGVTDAEGEVVRVYNQSAFGYFAQAFDGTGYAHAAADPQPYHLTTKEFDADIGLYYFNARWYDPAAGTFVARAKLPLTEEHPYTFCEQQPTGYVDPDGRFLLTPLCVAHFVTCTLIRLAREILCRWWCPQQLVESWVPGTSHKRLVPGPFKDPECMAECKCAINSGFVMKRICTGLATYATLACWTWRFIRWYKKPIIPPMKPVPPPAPNPYYWGPGYR